MLNNYATTVRVAEARGINWIDRATELACLTVLETEFPAVAADLVRIPTLLKLIRTGDTDGVSREVRRIVDGYREIERSADDEDDAAPEVQAAGQLLVDGPRSAQRSAQANRVINGHLMFYLRKIATQGIADPRPDLFYLQTAGSTDGIADPELGYFIDFAADLSADDVVEAFTDQPSATTGTAVRLLVQQAEAERGPGRTNIIEAACRLAEQLDPDDLQLVAPIAAGGVLADVGSTDWPRQATPGALLLGVIGARPDLVSRLLEQYPADDLAREGLLTRVTPLLAYANDDQAKLVYRLLASAYASHPSSLHDALTSLPTLSAARLFEETEGEILDALEDLSAQPATVVTAATAAASTTAASAQAASTSSSETAAQRYQALFTAVNTRTDDPNGLLLSAILELGQRFDDTGVRSIVQKLEDDAIEQIKDLERLNVHALLGIELAPIEHCDWWAKYLNDADSDDAQVYKSLDRLTKELPSATDDLSSSIAAAATALVAQFTDPIYNEDVAIVLEAVLRATPWPDADTTGHHIRESVYTISETARAHFDGEFINQMYVDDIVRGLDEYTGGAKYLPEARKRVSALDDDAAALVESALASRGLTATNLVVTLILRADAASTLKTNPLSADTILRAKGEEHATDLLGAWLDLAPPLSDAQKVLGKIMVNYPPLKAYADQLTVADRTTLWIDLHDRTQRAEEKWPIQAFKSVGNEGVASAAITRIAADIAKLKQQPQRDALVARLVAAKFTEQPAHKAATELVLQLLGTGVNGDTMLAARVTLHSGGVAYGKTTAVREAFDRAVAERPNSLNKTEQTKLIDRSLLTKPKKKKRGVLGVIDNIIGGD